MTRTDGLRFAPAYADGPYTPIATSATTNQPDAARAANPQKTFFQENGINDME